MLAQYSICGSLETESQEQKFMSCDCFLSVKVLHAGTLWTRAQGTAPDGKGSTKSARANQKSTLGESGRGH